VSAICWDQWFPEAARAMALQGAEILFYPTAIGSEPHDQNIDSRDHWKRVMQGHAGANLVGSEYWLPQPPIFLFIMWVYEMHILLFLSVSYIWCMHAMFTALLFVAIVVK